MKKIRKLWKSIGELTIFQWVVLTILTLTLLCCMFTVAVEYLLWSKLGGAP